jgi:acetylornithine deacetylase/succinyl-diaminopimelate desuccinylase-like protein
MMPIDRNLRRRLLLYGGCAAFALLAWMAPRIVKWIVPPVKVAAWDLEEIRADEASRLLVEYLRIDTSNPPGRTVEAVAFWKRLFECEGIPYTVTGDDPERPIFVGRLPGRSREGALLLLHHMDVIPAGDPKAWAVPPFAGRMGEKRDTLYLYGRGAIDMKNIGIAHFLSIAALRRAGIVPERDLVFVAEPGEESFTPEAGTGWLVEKRPDLLEGVTDVFTEGGINEVLTTDIDRFGIEVLQKANLGVTVSSPRKEALDAFRTFLGEKELAFPLRLVPEVLEFLEFIGPSRGDSWGRLVMNPKRVLSDPALVRSLPDVYGSLFHDSIYCGGVQPAPAGGGFELEALWALLPGSPVATARVEMERWARERGLALKVRFQTGDSVASPRSGRAWDALIRSLELDPTRADVGIYILSASYTSSSYLRAHGYRSYGVSTFSINVFDASHAHQPNERIHLPFFVEGVERMKRIVREFATSP